MFKHLIDNAEYNYWLGISTYAQIGILHTGSYSFMKTGFNILNKLEYWYCTSSIQIRFIVFADEF